MDDPIQLRKFVRRQILDGYDPEYTFSNLYRHFIGPEPHISSEIVKNCLSHIKKDDFNSVPVKFHLAFKILQTEFKKAERALRTRKSVNERNLDTYDILTPRYAVELREIDEFSDSFYLWDIVYGQKRKLNFEGEAPKRGEEYSVQSLTSEYFTLSREGTETVSILYLIRVDFQAFKCKIVDTLYLNDVYVRTGSDSADPTKFVMSFFRLNQNGEVASEHLCKARLVNEKLVLENLLLIDTNLHEQQAGHRVDLLINKVLRLIGDDVYTIGMGPQEVLYLAKLTFCSDRIEFTQLFNIGTKPGVNFYDYIQDSKWAYLDHAWYSVRKTYTEDSRLFKFDLDAHKIIELDFSVHTDDFRTYHLLLDGDVLQICNINGVTKQHVHWRWPLTNSDKLQNLAMTAIQRELMFMDDNEYRKIMIKLPPNLRPFGGNVAELDGATSSKFSGVKM